jgi:hypothetical protein
MLGGKWTYRSYHNSAALVGEDAAAALALIFGEGVFDLNEDGIGQVRGTLDMGSDYALTIDGTAGCAHDEDSPPVFALIGLGIDGTPTAGWRYDYRGVPAYSWPDGVNQIPCLVGSVVRVYAHGPGAPAGVTASFVAVRQPEIPTTAPSGDTPITAS